MIIYDYKKKDNIYKNLSQFINIIYWYWYILYINKNIKYYFFIVQEIYKIYLLANYPQ